MPKHPPSDKISIHIMGYVPSLIDLEELRLSNGRLLAKQNSYIQLGGQTFIVYGKKLLGQGTAGTVSVAQNTENSNEWIAIKKFNLNNIEMKAAALFKSMVTEREDKIQDNEKKLKSRIKIYTVLAKALEKKEQHKDNAMTTEDLQKIKREISEKEKKCEKLKSELKAVTTNQKTIIEKLKQELLLEYQTEVVSEFKTLKTLNKNIGEIATTPNDIQFGMALEKGVPLVNFIPPCILFDEKTHDQLKEISSEIKRIVDAKAQETKKLDNSKKESANSEKKPALEDKKNQKEEEKRIEPDNRLKVLMNKKIALQKEREQKTTGLIQSNSIAQSRLYDTAMLMLSTLIDIHQKGMIQCDMSARNFMYDPAANVIKPIDFGEVRRFEKDNPNVRRDPVGTPPYIPPEIIKQMTGIDPVIYNEKTMVYSYGVMLAQMFQLGELIESQHFLPIRQMQLFELGREEFKKNMSIPDINQRKQMLLLIKKMMSDSPNERPTLEEVSRFFKENIPDICLKKSKKLTTFIDINAYKKLSNQNKKLLIQDLKSSAYEVVLVSNEQEEELKLQKYKRQFEAFGLIVNPHLVIGDITTIQNDPTIFEKIASNNHQNRIHYDPLEIHGIDAKHSPVSSNSRIWTSSPQHNQRARTLELADEHKQKNENTQNNVIMPAKAESTADAKIPTKRTP